MKAIRIYETAALKFSKLKSCSCPIPKKVKFEFATQPLVLIFKTFTHVPDNTLRPCPPA